MGDHADVAQLVERDLAKVEVAGSSPVVRSSEFMDPGRNGRDPVSYSTTDARTEGPTRRRPKTCVESRRRLESLAIEMMIVVKGL
jgi:hypothetical protein